MVQFDFLSSVVSSFSLVSLAEIGDKSQLVCVALAARYRHWPVFWGASAAFLLLNFLAVAFGATLAAWVPESVITTVVALMFFVFGIQALRTAEEDEEISVAERSGHGIVLTTFLLIFVSEFGDKTQIAVAGLSTSLSAAPVWLGASLALVLVSGLGIWAGKRLMTRLPMHWLHRIGGGLFLMFSLIAGYRALTIVMV